MSTVGADVTGADVMGARDTIGAKRPPSPLFISSSSSVEVPKISGCCLSIVLAKTSPNQGVVIFKIVLNALFPGCVLGDIVCLRPVNILLTLSTFSLLLPLSTALPSGDEY